MARWWGRPAPVADREPVVLVDRRALAVEVAHRRMLLTDEPTSVILADYLDHLGVTS